MTCGYALQSESAQKQVSSSKATLPADALRETLLATPHDVQDQMRSRNARSAGCDRLRRRSRQLRLTTTHRVSNPIQMRDRSTVTLFWALETLTGRASKCELTLNVAQYALSLLLS